MLNGQKRWITNGGIAQVLTVMARTPMPDGQRDARSRRSSSRPTCPAFRSSRSGWRRWASAARPPAGWRSTTCSCRKENVLGQLGKGLKVALTVLDFGRTTFGASCTGAAKFCVARAVAARQPPRAVRPDAGQLRAGQGEAGLHAGRRVRDGGLHLSDRGPDRLGRRRLHARNGDAQGLRHRDAVADPQRHVPDPRRHWPISPISRSSG